MVSAFTMEIDDGPIIFRLPNMYFISFLFQQQKLESK